MLWGEKAPTKRQRHFFVTNEVGEDECSTEEIQEPKKSSPVNTINSMPEGFNVCGHPQQVTLTRSHQPKTKFSIMAWSKVLRHPKKEIEAKVEDTMCLKKLVQTKHGTSETHCFFIVVPSCFFRANSHQKNVQNQCRAQRAKAKKERHQEN